MLLLKITGRSGTGLTWNPFDISNNALRGASSIRRPAVWVLTLYVTTDYRKKVYVNREPELISGDLKIQ